MNPTTIERGTGEYKNLETAAVMLELLSPNGAKYKVEEVYFDIGQDWMWTTICRYGFRECQVLSPRDWSDILLADSSNELGAVVLDIRNGKYFADR